MPWFSLSIGRDTELLRLNDLSKVSQLAVAELGLRPGSDSDACAHRSRRRGDDRLEERQAGRCPSPAQRQGGSEPGQGKWQLCR